MEKNIQTDLDVSTAQLNVGPMKSFVSADVQVKTGDNFGTKTLGHQSHCTPGKRL